MDTERKTSILIVDDNPSMTRTLALILEREGCAVATATGGLEAVAKVNETPFDVIFMDVKMPVMNGVETFKRIKDIRPEAVVLMMTAYAVEDLIHEALQEGAYGIMYKPLDIERVVAVVREAMQARRGLLILVVDDDPGICITLRNILTRKGYQTGVAHTGEEAIAIAHTMVHDIIFIDMKLPTINGLETYLAVKEINPEAVAILITAYRQEMAELVEAALQDSAYTCLYKPLDMDEVLGLVDEIWERKQSEMMVEEGRVGWTKNSAS